MRPLLRSFGALCIVRGTEEDGAAKAAGERPRSTRAFAGMERHTMSDRPNIYASDAARSVSERKGERLACRNCVDESWLMENKLNMPHPSADENVELHPASMIGIMPVRDEFKERPPVYWPFCRSHGMISVIAGFKTVLLESEEGKRRVAAMLAQKATP